MNKPLEVTIKKEGKTFWKDPKEIAGVGLINILISESMSAEGKERFMDDMRGCGKTFQACLEACRRMLEGKKVLLKTSSIASAENALKECISIIYKSFGETSFIETRANPSPYILCNHNEGVIQFSGDLRSGRGFQYDLVVIDEDKSYQNITTHYNDSTLKLTSKEILIKALKDSK